MKLREKEERNFKIINFLNQAAGKNFKAKSEKAKRLINARFNEGWTFEDFFKVIKIKSAEWKGTDYEKYLRPETLFGTKFESYVNQKEAPEKKDWKSEFLGKTQEVDL